MRHSLDIITAFGSFVVIPFLGLLSLFRIRIFPYLLTFCLLWLFAGVLAIGGGVTPMGPGDIVTPEQRHAWFAVPYVRFVLRLWLFGLAVGVPLSVITWAHEHRALSKLVKLVSDFITVVTFAGGLVTFVKLMLTPVR